MVKTTIINCLIMIIYKQKYEFFHSHFSCLKVMGRQILNVQSWEAQVHTGFCDCVTQPVFTKYCTHFHHVPFHWITVLFMPVQEHISCLNFSLLLSTRLSLGSSKSWDMYGFLLGGRWKTYWYGQTESTISCDINLIWLSLELLHKVWWGKQESDKWYLKFDRFSG